MNTGQGICLVSMPFMPVLMPALGPSSLKASVSREGHRCHIFYGSLEWLRLMGEQGSPAEAIKDYSFVATAEDLGEAFFAPLLWPDTIAKVTDLVGALPTLPHGPLGVDEMVLMSERLLGLLDRSQDFIRRCVDTCDWSSYSVVGFSSTFSQNVASLALAREIKQVAPEVTVLFGGANCEGEMGAQLLRSFPWVDHVLSGEADLTLPEYVRALERGAPVDAIAGIQVRAEDDVAAIPARPVARMDDVASPDFSDYFQQRPDWLESVGATSLPVELSRGCWWGAVQHCVFCGLNPAGMVFRSKTPGRALEEIREPVRTWGRRPVVLVDNILDLDYIDTLLPDLESEGLILFCETKSNLREEQVRTLRLAGFTTIQPGVESLNTHTLKHMRKGARAATQLELLKWCRNEEIDPLWFYLYDFPGEDAAWYQDDIQLMEKIVHLPPPRNPNPVVIDRFSPLYGDPIGFGLRNLRPAWNSEIAYAGLDPDARMRLSYHFDADRTPSARDQYETQLWSAVRAWQRRYRAGAFLEQCIGDTVTLVRDGRHSHAVFAYLLVGWCHAVHKRLRRAARLNDLADLDRGDPISETLTADDLTLTMEAATVGAELLEGRTEQEALELLASRGIVTSVDARWLALATDGKGMS